MTKDITLEPGEVGYFRAPAGERFDVLWKAPSGSYVKVRATNTAPPPPDPDPEPEPLPVPTPTSKGIWADVDSLSMTGAAWDSLPSNPTRVVLSDQNENADVVLMGAALRARRSGEGKAAVIAALTASIGSESGARWLAIGRNLGAVVIAADLMDIRTGPVFDWLRGFTTKKLAHNNTGSPITFRESAWESGSNAAAQEGFALAALYAYLGDKEGLDWSWDAFRRYAGDRTSPHTISSNNDSWQENPSDPVGIQNKGAVKSGVNIDGAISNDMSRGGNLAAKPGFTQYPWTGLAGAVPAAVILSRQGYPAFTVADSALKRAAQYLKRIHDADPGAGWYDSTRGREVKHILNVVYGLGYPALLPVGANGHCIGHSDFTHPRTP